MSLSLPRRLFAPSSLCRLTLASLMACLLLCVLPPAHAGQYVLSSCTGGGGGGNPLTGDYSNGSIYIQANPSAGTATSLTSSIGGTGSDAPGPLVATLQWQRPPLPPTTRRRRH